MASHTAAPHEHELWPEAREENIPELSTLEKLPRRIIYLITAAVTVDIQAPYLPYGYLRRGERIRQIDAGARRGLASLCLVSKPIFSRAQRALYRNILITDAKTLVLLYRSFLGNPKLGSYVRQMGLNIDHRGSFVGIGTFEVYESHPIDLSPLLYGNKFEHELGQHLTSPFVGNRLAPHKVPIELLYTLQFRVLSCTSHLKSLDLNVHPQVPIFWTYESHNMDNIHMGVVTRVLHSLWPKTSRSLGSLKKLQLIGKEDPDLGARSPFVALISKHFLELPSLEQLSWINHSDGWLDGLPNPWASGMSRIPYSVA